MEFEVFLVSTLYWGSILLLFIWLSKRLSALREKLSKIDSE